MTSKALAQYAVFVSAVAIIIASCLLSSNCDGSEEDCFVVDGIYYLILSDNAVEAYDFDKLLQEAIIPSHVVHDGISYAVVSLNSLYRTQPFEYVYIPDTVTSIEGFIDELNRTNRIEISPLNPQYASRDDVIYSKNMTQLLLYPLTKTDSSFMIPEEVLSIHRYAFTSNKYLEEITIDGRIQLIENGAFQDCSNLKWINRTSVGNTLPEGLLTIGTSAFLGTGLEDICLPDTLRMIGQDAFGFSSIKSLHIGSGITFIGEAAFCSCLELESITSTSYYFHVEDDVLFKRDFETNQLILITYPAGKKDTSYRIPEEVIGIAPLAFHGIAYLEEVIFPHSMSTVPTHSFFYAQSLKRIVLSDSILSVDYSAFYECSLEEIVWGANITSIGSSAFEWNCLVDLVLPDTIHTIDDLAFARNFDLSHVFIPDGVRYMGNRVFADDTLIEDIEFGGSAPYMARNSLSISDDEFDLFVLHLTVQKGFVLPDRALDDHTALVLDIKGLLPYPYENLIVVLLCAIIVMFILRFVKDV